MNRADYLNDPVRDDPSTNPWGALHPPVFFVFTPAASKLARGENKKSRALSAQGLIEVGGGFEPP
jgi:hypothetical protein